MIRQVGLFKFLKNNYDSDEDLKDLEELVYEDENGFRNKRSINDMIHSYQVGSYTGSNHNDDLEEELYKTAGSDASADESRGLTEKTKKQQADVLKEEEKYDHLLNSIQAQTLIRTVDKVNLGGAVNNTQDNLEEVDTAGFTGSEVGSFVKSQCDIMEEASRYIENAKVEYDSVTDYYEDIQRIENAPENIKLKLMYAADHVDNLSVDRRIFKSPENKLSNKVYRMMESYEEDFPEALVKLRHDEEDYNTVLKNVRIIKGERSMYRIEANDLVKKQLRIKKYSVLMLALLVGVFVIFLLISAASPDDEHIGMFITVVILALTLSLGLFAYLKSTERKVYVTEVKLNKATALLNKYKIKYVNAVNVLEYEYACPTSASELARIIEYFIKNECLGIYHAVCQGSCSRLEYARTILEYANATDKLKLVPANNNKPVYSVLDNMMLRLEHIEQPKNWKDALKEYINLSGGC